MGAVAGDAVIELRDGRRLGYAIYGDPQGFPVLSGHGGLLCRLDSSPIRNAAAEPGVRSLGASR